MEAHLDGMAQLLLVERATRVEIQLVKEFVRLRIVDGQVELLAHRDAKLVALDLLVACRCHAATAAIRVRARES